MDYSKQKSVDDSYSYEVKGVKHILSDYHALQEIASYGNNQPITYLMIDMKTAMQQAGLTKEELKILTYRYALQLTPMEALLYADLDLGQALRVERYAIYKIAAALKGDMGTGDKLTYIASTAKTVKQHVHSVMDRETFMFDLTDEINTDLLQILQERDELAKETLRQRTEGKPVFTEDVATEYEYPSHEVSNNKKGKYDYFSEQDRKNNVSYDDFSSYSVSLKTTGTKKAITNSDSTSNKKAVRV